MRKSKGKTAEMLKLFLVIFLSFAMIFNGPSGMSKVLAEDHGVVDEIENNQIADADEYINGEEYADDIEDSDDTEGNEDIDETDDTEGSIDDTEGTQHILELLQTPQLDKSDITVKNYVSGISDRVIVNNIEAGDTVTVYYKNGAAELSKSVIADDTSVIIEIPQLGIGASSIEVTVKEPDKTESERIEINYVSEPIPWAIYGHTGNWGEHKDGTQGNSAPNTTPVYPPEDENPLGKDYQQHIIVKEKGSRITFYGYGKNAFKDFIMVPTDSDAKKSITFDLDLSKVNYWSSVKISDKLKVNII